MDVEAPEFDGIALAEIGAQQITTFAAAGLAEFSSVEPKAKGGNFVLGFGFGKIEVKKPPGGARISILNSRRPVLADVSSQEVNQRHEVIDRVGCDGRQQVLGGQP